MNGMWEEKRGKVMRSTRFVLHGAASVVARATLDLCCSAMVAGGSKNAGSG